MITKEEYLEKIEELSEQVKSDMLAAAKSLWVSGAIDQNAYHNDYLLPKLFMVAYANRLKNNFHPLEANNKNKSEIENFECFI